MGVTENSGIPSTASTGTSTLSQFWKPFAYPAFTALWIAAFFSDIGIWMHTIGATWMVTKMEGSPLLISLVLTLTSLPVFIMGIPAGAVADIFNRRKILLFTQLWMTCFAAALAIITYFGIYSPWLILLFSFCLALGPALNETVWQSIVQSLVPSGHLPAGIVLNGLSINLARAIGPALGGIIIAYSSPFLVFSINAICFLMTFFIVLSWNGPITTTATQTQRFIAAMRSGVVYAGNAVQIRPVFIRVFVFAFGVSALWGLLSYVIVNKLGWSASVYGNSLFIIGLGAITSAILLPLINNRVSLNQKLFGSSLIIVASLVSLVYVTNIYVLFLFLFLSGIAWLAAMSSFNVALQTNIPQWIQARAISIYLLVFQGGLALGSFVWGLVADNFGMWYASMGASIVMVFGLALAFPFSLNVSRKPDWSPYNIWPEPFLNLQVAPEDGPVLVHIDYIVSKENIQKFTAAFEKLKILRIRDGVLQVGLFQDVSNPELITEFFLLESWQEYLLQRGRFTNEDKATENAVLALHSGPDAPVIRQMVAQTEKSP